MRYVSRKMPVDIMGVVTSCGSLGTIKRKADQTELPRRDVTLADSRYVTVCWMVQGYICSLETPARLQVMRAETNADVFICAAVATV